MEIREVAIDEGKAGERPSADMGDLEALAPVRRITGDRVLNTWKRVEVEVLNLDDSPFPLLADLDDGRLRRELTWRQRITIARRLLQEEGPAAELRQRQGKKVRGNSPKGSALDLVAGSVGKDRKTLTKALEVDDYVKTEPRLDWLLDDMDRTGKVDGASRTVMQHKHDPEQFEENDQGHLVPRTIANDPASDERFTAWKAGLEIDTLGKHLIGVVPRLGTDNQQDVVERLLYMVWRVVSAVGKAKEMPEEEASQKVCAYFEKCRY